MIRRTAGLAASLLLTLALTACGGSSLHATAGSWASATGDGLALSRGWVEAAGAGASSMPGMEMSAQSAAYATIRNTGSAADALVAVSTSAAGSATLHATRASANGSAGTMVAVKAVPVPAGGSVTLQPGGYHVMLTDLTSSFAAGSAITMTWTFRSGTTLTASFPVIAASDRPEQDG